MAKTRSQCLQHKYIAENHEESVRLRKIDEKNAIYNNLTEEEKWAIQLFTDYSIPRTDNDLRKARKILRVLHKEIASQNFMHRIALASINNEVPIEAQVSLFPYVLTKAPSEIELTVNKKELTDEALDERIQELSKELGREDNGH